MALDGLVIAALAAELQNLLAGGRIDRAQQPTDDDILLTIRNDHTNFRLLLSANKSYPRAHLTNRFSAPNPSTAPMFCMLMRKHLEGGRVQQIVQRRRERMLFIDVDTRDETGDRVTRRIVIEMMGKHSNILLLDRPDGQIIDAISHVSRAVNRHREVLPGRAYVYPPEQDKIDPFIETAKGFKARREAHPDMTAGQFAVRTYLGVSPFFGRELEYAVTESAAQDVESEWRQFADLVQRAKDVEEPTAVRDAFGRFTSFYVLAPGHPEGTRVSFRTVNECLDMFYSEKALADIARSKAGSFLRLARTEREKDLQKADKFRRLLDAGQEAERWRIAAELLTAHLPEIPRGAREVQLPNFYEENRALAIDLDPAKSPLENANAYYKRYGKYKKGLDITREQLALAEQDASYLETVIHELETCRLEDLPGIEAELREAGFLKAAQGRGRSRSATGAKGVNDKRGKHAAKSGTGRFTPHTYLAADGTPIWVGRNNRENDIVTLRLARKQYLWLHVKDAPGSHVIVAADSPGDDTLREAALIAMHFSRERDSSRAQVDVVPVKAIWKPNGARPGFVLFEGQKTLSVARDDETLTRLLATHEPPKGLIDVR